MRECEICKRNAISGTTGYSLCEHCYVDCLYIGHKLIHYGFVQEVKTSAKFLKLIL